MSEEEARYTLAEAQRIMRDDQCARGKHAPIVEIAEFGEPVSTFLCDCGRFRYTATLVSS